MDVRRRELNARRQGRAVVREAEVEAESQLSALSSQLKDESQAPRAEREQDGIPGQLKLYICMGAWC